MYQYKANIRILDQLTKKLVIHSMIGYGDTANRARTELLNKLQTEGHNNIEIINAVTNVMEE